MHTYSTYWEGKYLIMHTYRADFGGNRFLSSYSLRFLFLHLLLFLKLSKKNREQPFSNALTSKGDIDKLHTIVVYLFISGFTSLSTLYRSYHNGQGLYKIYIIAHERKSQQQQHSPKT